MEIKNKTIVITGGASGIGKAVAFHFAKLGANIVIADINKENIDKTISEIKKINDNVIGFQTDVTSDSDVSNLMDKTIEKFNSINFVVPCAGIIKDSLMISTDKETGKVKRYMDTKSFKQVIEVNLIGTFITLREAAIRMVNNNWEGVLFTISSINKVGQIGQLNYSSTKVAVGLWPKILAGEFQMKNIKNIRIVGIAPGYAATPILTGMSQKALDNIIKDIHIGRLIEPEEIAKLIAFAVENDAIDGTTIEISGGITYGPFAIAK